MKTDGKKVNLDDVDFGKILDDMATPEAQSRVFAAIDAEIEAYDRAKAESEFWDEYVSTPTPSETSHLKVIK